MSRAPGAAAVRALRPTRDPLDPWRPLGTTLETEREPDGSSRRALTVFVAGAECPYACVFCDLWRFTLEGPSPKGAVPSQVRAALDECPEPLGQGGVEALKIYNASNYFEPRAVPPEDDEALARLGRPFARVTVENHPRFVGPRCRALAERLEGRLEVAMGLETVHPGLLRRLGKGIDLDDFDRAVDLLHGWGVAVRVFVLLPAPGLGRTAGTEWAIRSVEHATRLGVGRVAIVPTRVGPGGLPFAPDGRAETPHLADLELALAATVATSGVVVTVDDWDLERVEACPACASARRARLREMSASGRVPPVLACDQCEEGWE